PRCDRERQRRRSRVCPTPGPFPRWETIDWENEDDSTRIAPAKCRRRQIQRTEMAEDTAPGYRSTEGIPERSRPCDDPRSPTSSSMSAGLCRAFSEPLGQRFLHLIARLAESALAALVIEEGQQRLAA